MLTIHQHLVYISTRLSRLLFGSPCDAYHFYLLCELYFVHSVYVVYILLYSYSGHNTTWLFWPLARIESFVTRIAYSCRGGAWDGLRGAWAPIRERQPRVRKFWYFRLWQIETNSVPLMLHHQGPVRRAHDTSPKHLVSWIKGCFVSNCQQIWLLWRLTGLRHCGLKQVGRFERCNFPTDSCKFPTKVISLLMFKISVHLFKFFWNWNF